MLNIDMNSIFYLFTCYEMQSSDNVWILKNGIKLFSLRIGAICAFVYMYKMKLVSKSQYTNYFIWRLVVHHQCIFATSTKTLSISEV